MKAIQFLGMTAFMAAMLTGCSNDRTWLTATFLMTTSSVLLPE